MDTDLGQVFTKKIVADYMVDQFTLPSDSVVLDPCFGEGVFLNSLLERTPYQVHGVELDNNLFARGVQKYPEIQLVNCDFLSYEADGTFDGVIMNPPYLRQEKIDELKDFGVTKDILLQNRIFKDLSRKANLYMYFILKALDLLRPNGELIAIFPGSWMNSKVGVNFQKEIDKVANTLSLIKVTGDPFETKALVDVVIIKLVKSSKFEDCNPKAINVNVDEISEDNLGEVNVKELFSVPFHRYADVKRGITTGFNKFFINPQVKNSEEYLRDIISSPKQIKGYSTNGTVVDKLLLLDSNIEKSEELLEYINEYELIVKETQKPSTIYNKLDSENWYELKEVGSSGIWFNYFVRNDMKFIYNESCALARDNFYVITPKIDVYVLFALLNNYYTYYQLEANGKKYGSGLLKLQTYDIKGLTFIDIDDMNESDLNELKVVSNNLINTGDISNIDAITNIISRYTEVMGIKIKDAYLNIKNKRLEETL